VAKEHAKWSPSCGTTYAFEPDIRINHDAMDLLDESQKQDWYNHFPFRSPHHPLCIVLLTSHRSTSSFGQPTNQPTG
jgi:hypothetical protein